MGDCWWPVAVAAEQARFTPEDWIRILAWGLGAIAVLLAAWIGALIWRRRLSQSEGRTGPAWTLDDLRQLRSDGQISEEEYDRLRQLMVDQVRGRAGGRSATAASTPPAGASAAGPPDPPANDDEPGPSKADGN